MINVRSSPSAVFPALIFFLCFASGGLLAQGPKPPVARQDNVKEVIHGVEIVDPYRWLEEQDSKETRDWVTAENAYTHSLLDGLPIRDRAFQQLMNLVNHDSSTPPALENGVYFFYKRAAGQDLRSAYMRRGPTGKDELLLDPLPLSADHTTSIGGLDPT